MAGQVHPIKKIPAPNAHDGRRLAHSIMTAYVTEKLLTDGKAQMQNLKKIFPDPICSYQSRLSALGIFAFSDKTCKSWVPKKDIKILSPDELISCVDVAMFISIRKLEEKD